MSVLTPTSKANFARMFGTEAKSFVAKCDLFSMRLSDAAESEKSKPLRLEMHKISSEINVLVDKVHKMLGTTAL